MKHVLEQAIISVNQKRYLLVLIFLSPLLNFLAGINIDIYSPSMPSIATYFETSVVVTKNTISITLLGWTIGALFFGALIDSIGRKKVLVYGLSAYVIASVFAPWCHSIDQLMVVRFLQGFTISTVTVGCRALIIDVMSGRRYAIAILYTSVGYGLGPILGPFIGGILQHYIGWQANFLALACTAVVLLVVLFAFLKETIPRRHSLRLPQVFARYKKVITHKQFIAGSVVAGLKQIQMMLYPALGPFIVENILGYNALTYGNTALAIGASYLVGTLINRFLLEHLRAKSVCYFGYGVMLIAILLSYAFTALWTLNLITIMIPLILLCISAGLIFPSILGANLKQFPDSAGIATATQSALVLFTSSVGIFLVSHIAIKGLLSLSIIFSVIALLEWSIFFPVYRRLLDY